MSELFYLTQPKFRAGAMLDTYGGAISLVACNAKGGGGVYKNWAFPQKREGGEWVANKKAIPVKVVLGESKEEALATLEFFRAVIAGEDAQSNFTGGSNNNGETTSTTGEDEYNEYSGDYKGPPAFEDDDIPF